MPALIAFIAWRLFGSAEKAALAALMWIAMPLVAIGAVFVAPDAPLVVFWTLGLAALVELWRTGETRWLIALGLALGLALQSKFTAAFFAAGVALALIATPSLRRWLVRPRSSPASRLALADLRPVRRLERRAWLGDLRQAARPRGPGRICALLPGRVPRCADRAHQSAGCRSRSSPPFAAIPWRARRSARSRDEARRILACTIAPAAAYFLLHSLHDRVQGNWLAPLYPALAILAADWVAEVRRTGGSGFAATIAKAAPWAAPVGLAVAALTFAEAATGAVPLGAANPLARLEGFREPGARSRRQGARRRRPLCPDPGLCADFADDLLRRSGDPVVQPEQRMRWIFEPEPPESLFAAPGLALGEPGRRFDLILKMRFRDVEPAGLLQRRQAGGTLEAYELYRVADPYAPVLDPVCERGEINLQRQCPP